MWTPPCQQQLCSIKELMRAYVRALIEKLSRLSDIYANSLSNLQSELYALSAALT